MVSLVIGAHLLPLSQFQAVTYVECREEPSLTGADLVQLVDNLLSQAKYSSCSEDFKEELRLALQFTITSLTLQVGKSSSDSGSPGDFLLSSCLLDWFGNKPPHDKTNKMRPGKTQISLVILLVLSCGGSNELEGL